MTEGGSLTGTKSRHSPRDMLIDEKRFWSANAPRLRPSLRKDPELGVNKCSGSDRISESLLQRDRNGHGQVVIVQSSRNPRSGKSARSTRGMAGGPTSFWRLRNNCIAGLLQNCHISILHQSLTTICASRSINGLFDHLI